MSKSFLRNVVGEYMTTLGQKDGKVVIVNADLSGTCRNRSFVDTFPERSFNVGIAEQNMVSFASGLAAEGFVTYVFSMAPFLSMRACEQCRTDVAYGNRNVRLIGVYAGVSGGISGVTHWGIEDCGIMSAIPGIVVLELSDAYQAKQLLDLSLKIEGPIYFRITVESTEDIYDNNNEFRIGGSQTVLDGSDGAILCSGVVVQYAINAAKMVLDETGKRIRVVDMYSIKPVDEAAIVSAAKTGNILVAQDHNVFGGLGSSVATVIAEKGLKTNYKTVGITDEYAPMAHAPYLYKKYGFDTEGLKNYVIEMINNHSY